MHAYATTEQLGAWAGEQVDLLEGEKLLRSATIRINHAIRNAIYTVGDDDMPSDPDVLAALQDATCAQAEWFMETGDRIGAGTAAPSQLGSLRFDANTGGGDADGRLLGPEALTILRNAGLITTTVSVLR